MKALLKALRVRRPPGTVSAQLSNYYDHAFTRPEWREHYTKSSYYFLWTVLVDRLLRSGVEKVIELGCGPGQLACLLRDKGVTRYLGIDFSATAVRLAREACPEFVFACADLAKDPILATADYDCVVTLEFLEHVEADLEILQRVRPGTKIFATVPSFPYISHVRHFRSVEEVRARYQGVIAALSVDSFLNAHRRTFYLMEGVSRGMNQ
jgi:SAM-dependent methyltransferase